MSPFRAIFRRSLATSLLLAIAAVLPARGQTAVEWTGVSNSTWSTTTNWTSVTSPNYPNNSTEIAVFGGSWSNTSRQPTIGNTSYAIGGIVVESNVPTPLTLAGTGTLTINPSGWSGTVGLDNQSAGAATIGAKLALGSDQTWQASNVNGGGWTFSSTIALGSHTLTLNAANTSNTIAANGVISGAGNLAISGDGTVTLSAANTYSGTTTINDGATLKYSGSGSLSTSTAVTVNTGGTYNLNNSSENIASIAGGGDILLGSGTLTNGGSGTTAFSGEISGTGSLVKSGTGSLSLSGNNSYGGTTTLSAGTLDAGSDSAFSSGQLNFNGGTLTASGGGTRTLANAVLVGANVAIGGANDLTFSGAFSEAGSRTLSITNTGTTTFANTFTLAASNQTATMTINVDGASGGAIISGVVQNGAGSGPDSLTKSGAGNLILSGANTYTGTTTVAGGTLALSGAGVISTGNLNLNGGVLATQGTFSRALGANGNQFQFGSSGGGFAAYGGALSVSLSGSQTWGSTSRFLQSGSSLILGSSLADNVVDWTSNFSLGSAARTITVNDNVNSANDYAKISGVISSSNSSGALIKDGDGLLVLSNANTYAGSTTVNGGTLSLQNASALGSGSAATTVNSGGTLQLDGVSVARSGTLTLNGDGNGNGALRSVNGANTYTGNITLGGAATIASGTAGNLFTVGTWTVNSVAMGTNTLTVDGAGDIKIKANLNGTTGGFVKNGTGTTTFNGDGNSYTGATTVNQGTLVLDTLNNAVPDNAVLGNLVIGNGTGAANSVKVLYGTGSASNKIANTSQITINSDGKLDMNGDRNGNADTVGALVFYGGHVDTGSGGLLTITGDVTTHANSANQAAVIDGHLDLNGATRTFTVENGGLASDLTVNATINSGSFIKDGDGKMTVTSSNSYTGTTQVGHGILNIQDSNALGANRGGDVAGGTTVADGAALQLEKNTANLAIGNEALNLSGSGYNNADGALRNISGDNSLAGTVTLGANARINTDAGSLTVTGDFTGTSQTLTVGGASNTLLSGAIGTGTGGIVKDGGGTLTLSGTTTNSFSGGLTVQDGTVILDKTSGLNASGTGSVTVGDGTGAANSAVLQLNQNQQIANSAAVTIQGDGKLDLNGKTETIGSLSGTGSGTLAIGSGALIVGDANSTSYSGAITGTSAASLTKQGTGTLTLTGDINFGGSVTVTGTLGNTLAFTGNIPSIAGELTLGAGSTLALNLTGAAHTLTIDTLHITGNTTIDFGASSNSILNINNLIIDSGVTLVSITNWTNASDFFFAQAWSGATLNTVGAGNPEMQVTFLGYSPTQTAWLSNNPWAGYNQITPAPEPSTYGFIFMAAGLALVGYRRFRPAKKSRV